MSMIIAGGGAASVFTGEGQATVTFSATGTGRVTGASVETTVSPVQNVANCNGGTATRFRLALPEAVTGGDFLAICVTETGGTKVVSINDHVEGYDALVASLDPIAWWKYNETSGNIVIDSGTGDNNGIASGAFIVGIPGPIMGIPADTAYEFFQSSGSGTSIGSGLLGVGALGAGLLGGGGESTESGGQVQVVQAPDLQFGTTSFSIAGWINGSAVSGSNAYIFNNTDDSTGASVARGPLGWAIRGMGLMGAGLLRSGTAGYALQMNETTDHLEFAVSDADGNSIAVQTPTGYGDSGWHFVVGVINRSSELLSLYVDGELIGNDSIAGVGSVSNTATAPTMADGLIGDLSQVFIVDYALTAAQIEALYYDSTVVPSSNRWIQAAYSYNSGHGAEIWYARGVKQGVTVITVDLTSQAASTSCCANLSEWEGVWYVDPLDQWSQNFGQSNVASTQQVMPRQGSDLFLAAVQTNNGLVSGASGYVNLTTGGNGAAAYYVSPYEVAETTSWNTLGISTWATCHASFVAGQAGLNPDFQMPETLIEISTTNNYQAPLEQLGVWTNLSWYVRQMTLGPMGRAHMLDRVQATTASFTLNNRTGAWNPWNYDSPFYGSGFGMKPMNPVKVTAAWDGITSSVFYGYLQALTPQIADVLNVDVELASNDILAMLSLKYLSSNTYAQLIIADGESG